MNWKRIKFKNIAELNKSLQIVVDIGAATAFRDDKLGDIKVYDYEPTCSIYINTKHSKFLEKLNKKFKSVEYGVDAPKEFTDENWHWTIL